MKYTLFKLITEGVKLEIDLDVCGEELEILEYVEPKECIVQKGKVKDVGEEE